MSKKGVGLTAFGIFEVHFSNSNLGSFECNLS